MLEDAYLVRLWTTAEGLPVNHIMDVHQSQDGYLWLATGGGVVRFDGQVFDVFRREDIPGWTTSFASAIYEDRSGRLWLTTDNGEMARYADGVFEPVTDERGHDPGRVESWYEDADGVLWVGTETGLLRFQGSQGRRYTREDGLPADTIRVVHRDRQGTLWVLTSRGLARWTDGAFRAEAIQPVPRCANHGVHARRGVYEGPDGALWISCDRLLRLYQGRLTPFDTGSSSPLNRFLVDRQGAFWVGTVDGGLLRWQHGEWTHYRPGEHLPWARVWPALEDTQGGLWVAASRNGSGLARIRGDTVQSVALSEHIGNDVIVDVIQDAEGTLWIATDVGLASLRPRRVRTLDKGPGGAILFPLYQHDDGTVWAGTWGDGLYERRDGVWQHWTTEHGLVSNDVRSLYVDRAGGLWVGTLSGLSRLQNGVVESLSLGSEWVPYDLEEDRDGTLWVVGRGVWRMEEGELVREARFSDVVEARFAHEASNGDLWIGTRRGLYRRRQGAWRRYTLDDGLMSEHFVSVYEDARGVIFFGTHGGGLHRFEEERFFVYTRDHGLPGEGIWRILEDDLGFVWMSSDQGIYRMARSDLDGIAAGTRARLDALVLTETDGMPSAECSSGSPGGWKMQDGTLWFPTIKGPAIIDPSTFSLNERPPPVRIKRVMADGEALALDGTASIAPDARMVEIHYAALSYVASEKNRYRYRLEGYDRDWIEADRRRFATYTNLPPGTYTFRVVAANNDGIWNEAGASYRFRVSASWYELWWLRVLGALLAGGIFAFMVSYRKKWREARETARALRKEQKRTVAQSRQLAEQAQRLQEIDRFKSRFFTNLSHEFRTPITLIYALVDDLLAERAGTLSEEARSQLEVVCRNTRRLEHLVDQLLDLARLESGRLLLSASRVDLAGFVGEVVEGCVPLAERRGVHLSFHVTSSPLPAHADPDKLEKILVNLLTNAIKFTPAGGKVQVELEGDAGQVVLRVRDTGKGIPDHELPHIFDRFHQVEDPSRLPHEGLGIGLSLVKDLVGLHGGEVRVESTVGFGSTFTVQIPRWQPGGSNNGKEPSPSGRKDHVPPVYGRQESAARAETADEGVEPEGDGAVQSDGARPVVLLVEDNPDMRAYLRRHLQAEWTVVEAQDGREALDLARQVRPSAIVSDVMMPEADGLDLVRTLKQDDALRLIPVLLLTARVGAADAAEGLAAGAEDYMRKPFDMDELKARLRRMVQSRQAWREQYSHTVVVQPNDIEIDADDAVFLNEAQAVVEAHMGDANFTVDFFADEMGLSRSQLTRKLNRIAGMSPGVLVRKMRLQRAAQLLRKKTGAGAVGEVARAVGFRDVDYFSKQFRKEFGVSPSAYRESDAWSRDE